MENLENIKDSDVATIDTNETFPLVSTSKTKKSIYTEFEQQVISAASTKPVDRVCALFGINETQLNDILNKK
jgi:hypothetical protein